MTLRDELCDILARLFRIPVAGKPVTILDLAGVPSDVVNVIVSVLCRLAFDLPLWSETSVPITIICEEAHRYAPRDRSLGFDAAKRALFRIARRGAKMACHWASSVSGRRIWRAACCRNATRSSHRG